MLKKPTHCMVLFGTCSQTFCRAEQLKISDYFCRLSRKAFPVSLCKILVAVFYSVHLSLMKPKESSCSPFILPTLKSGVPLKFTLASTSSSKHLKNKLKLKVVPHSRIKT